MGPRAATISRLSAMPFPSLGDRAANHNPDRAFRGPPHGAIFPLPCPGAIEPPPQPSLSRGVRQRANRRRAHAEASLDCCASLNAAALHDSSFFRGVPSSSQLSVLSHIHDSCGVRPPGGADFLPEEALRTLLGTDAIYGSDQGSVGSLVSFGSGEVSLPRGQSVAPNLKDLLEGSAFQDVSRPVERMLLSSEELEGEFEKCVPNVYLDPVLRHNRGKYLEFLKDLVSCGVLGVAESVRCELGIFFVSKKGDVCA